MRRRRDQPLAGVRVLVGRARHQAGALSSLLRERGATVLEIPFIQIRKPASFRPLDSALRDLRQYDWLILTSVNGVEALWQRMAKLRLSKRHVKHLQIAAIGPATSKAIEKRGVKVDVVPEEYVAESVVKALRRSVKGKRVLLVRAKVARDVIPRRLRQLDAIVDVVEAYETVMPSRSAAKLRSVMRDPSRRPQVITFTSSSTASNFAALLGSQKRNLLGKRVLPDICFASIGPVTSATLRKLRLPVSTEATPYTIPALVTAIEEAILTQRL
jgi:uroporphyrinogen-III synthase